MPGHNSPAEVAYLDEALDILQKNALNTEHGAVIFLTVAVDADRSGKVYGGAISPDVETGGDGIPEEALQWLAERSGCNE